MCLLLVCRFSNQLIIKKEPPLFTIFMSLNYMLIISVQLLDHQCFLVVVFCTISFSCGYSLYLGSIQSYGDILGSFYFFVFLQLQCVHPCIYDHQHIDYYQARERKSLGLGFFLMRKVVIITYSTFLYGDISNCSTLWGKKGGISTIIKMGNPP